MDMSRIDEVVPAGATEVWAVDNIVFSHNFHIHDAAFTILDINGKPPPANMAGWKDTVFLGNHAKVTLAVKFGTSADPLVPYVYHCHLLRHEDRGMMGQFTVVMPGTENSAPRQIPTEHSSHQPG